MTSKWLELELGCRRIGLLDEADLAREKVHAEEHGYPFMFFRGRQTTGDRLLFSGPNPPVQIETPATTGTPSTPPVRIETPAASPRGNSINLFEVFKR